MKKLVALVLAGATMLMTGCGSTQTAETDAYKGQTLKFYNWGRICRRKMLLQILKNSMVVKLFLNISIQMK